MATPEEIKAYANKRGFKPQERKPINPVLADFKRAVSQEQSPTTGFTPEQETQYNAAQTAAKAAPFVGGEKLAQGIGKALAKESVEQTAALQDKTRIGRIDALVSELKSAFEQGRKEDVTRLQQELRNEIAIPSEGAKTLTDFQETVPTTREIIGSTGQLAALAIPGVGANAKLATKVAAGAGTGYAFDISRKLQDENVDLEKAFIPGVGTAVGATIPLLSWTVGKIGNAASERVAKGQINSLIKPKKTDLAYGKDPAQALLREKITGNSLDDVGEKVDKTISRRVSEAQTKAANTVGSVDLTNSLSPIDDAINTAGKQNNQSLVNRLKNIKTSLTNNLTVNSDGQIVSQGVRDLGNFNVSNALDFKREVGALGAWTGNPSDDKLVNSAIKGVFGNVKGAIEKIAPELTDDIEHIASLIGARNAIKNRIDTLARSNTVAFTDKLFAGGGILGSVIFQNPLPALAGVGEVVANRLLSSTAFKTRFAQWLANAPKAQVIQLAQEVPWTKLLIAGGTGAAVKQ